MRNDGVAEPASTSVDRSGAHRLIELSEELRAPVAAGEQACCCPSRPAVRVVLPATTQRDHPVDLLLCAHHYRLSGVTLARQGAHIFDPSGALMVYDGVVAVDRIAR